jgi:hypothetical protein
VGQNITARDSACFPGQKPVRQKSIGDDLMFGYFASKVK